MNWSLAWHWLMFFVGAFIYMAQRAYYGVQGPRRVATSYPDYVYRCWGPLLFRFAVDSCFYWATFTPVLLAAIVRSFGWDAFAAEVEGATSYGFFALAFGLMVDFAVDFSVTKIPLLRDVWPQMPDPLPQPAVVQSAIVETTQTTHVTALESRTTIVPGGDPAPKEPKP